VYRLFVALYAVSGFCILSMETMWIRDMGLHTGKTILSASWIIAVFFVCAAAGNGVAHRVIRRTTRPGLVYGVAELATGLTALALFALRDVLFWPLRGTGGCEYAYAVAIAGLPSFLSGLSLPALTGLLVTPEARVSRGAWLYAANLGGAASGVLLGGLVLPLYAGYGGAFTIVSVTMMLQGGIALTLGRRVVPVPVPDDDGAAAAPRRTGESLGVAVLFLSGVCSLGLEVIALHYFHLITRSSIYAVSAVFAAFILNLGIGAAAASLLSGRVGPRWRLLGWIMAVTGIIAMSMHVLLGALVGAAFMSPGESPAAYTFRSAAWALLLLLPLVASAGAVFPLAWKTVRAKVASGRAFGFLFLVNKLGAAVGVFVVPYVLLETAGLAGSLVLIGAVYAALGVAGLARGAGRMPALIGGACCAVALAANAIAASPPVSLSEGETLIDVETGRGGVIAVVEDREGSRHIVLDHSYMLNGTQRALSAQRHEGWLPLAYHPRPRAVMFIGMASGISADAVLDYPVENLCAVELVPEVARVARRHFEPWNARLFADTRARVVIDDGRHALLASADGFDVVICDLFNPAREGTAAMYSADFFAAALARLADRGLFCLWLAAYQFDERTAGSVVSTFASVFPNALVIRGNLDPLQPIVGLLGSADRFDLSHAFLEGRTGAHAPGAVGSASPFFRSVANFRCTLMGDLQSRAEDFAAYPLNTDDRPVIAFRGPAVIPAGRNLRGHTLLNWLGRRFLEPAYPSCTLAATDPADVVNGIRAGNYYFAAAVSAAPIPGLYEAKRLKRARQVDRMIRQARVISPRTDVRADELGQ